MGKRKEKGEKGRGKGKGKGKEERGKGEGAMLGYSPRTGPAIRYTSCTVISYGSENGFAHGINKDILPEKNCVTDDRI